MPSHLTEDTEAQKGQAVTFTCADSLPSWACDPHSSLLSGGESSRPWSQAPGGCKQDEPIQPVPEGGPHGSTAHPVTRTMCLAYTVQDNIYPPHVAAAYLNLTVATEEQTISVATHTKGYCTEARHRLVQREQRQGG